MTSNLLFGDRTLGVSVCSKECEQEYLGSLSSEDETRVLKRLDRRIETVKFQERICWATAILGVFALTVGFFLKDTNVFLAATVPMTVGAFLTRHFEKKNRRLVWMRRHIRI